MNSDELYKVLYAIITLGGGGVVGWFTSRMARKTGAEANQIAGTDNLLTQYRNLLNEVQEERKGKAAELMEVHERLTEFEKRERQREERQRNRDVAMRKYITKLHKHINDGNPPPPPAVPPELDD